MQANAIDPVAVRKCVADSNSSFSPPVFLNHLLEEELLQREDMSIVSLPSMVVNNVILRGGNLPAVLLQAVCSAYPSDPKPRLCTDCLNADPSQVDACMNPPAPAPAPSSSTMPGWAVGIIIFFVVAIVAGVGGAWWFFRRQKAEVKEMLDDYRALSACPPAPPCEHRSPVLPTLAPPASTVSVQWNLVRPNPRTLLVAAATRRAWCLASATLRAAS